MAQFRVVPPRARGCAGRATPVWPVTLGAWAVLVCGATPSAASRRPPQHVTPIVEPGFGVPDEPDGPNPGNQMKSLTRTVGTTVVRTVPASSPSRIARLLAFLKARWIGR